VQGFLTGVLQSYARKYSVAINTLEFASAYVAGSPRELEVAPEDGCIVYGLWMEGASWSWASKGIVDASPGILHSVRGGNGGGGGGCLGHCCLFEY
jgi:dynein heavy chain